MMLGIQGVGRMGEHWDMPPREQFNWVSNMNKFLSVIKGEKNIQAASRGCGTAERPQTKVATLEKGGEINVMESRWKVGMRAQTVR